MQQALGSGSISLPTDAPVRPLLKNWRARRRLGACDPIEVCDQARQQGDEQPGLLVREVAQDLMITPEQDSNRVRQARFRDLR